MLLQHLCFQPRLLLRTRVLASGGELECIYPRVRRPKGRFSAAARMWRRVRPAPAPPTRLYPWPCSALACIVGCWYVVHGSQRD